MKNWPGRSYYRSQLMFGPEKAPRKRLLPNSKQKRAPAKANNSEEIAKRPDKPICKSQTEEAACERNLI